MMDNHDGYDRAQKGLMKNVAVRGTRAALKTAGKFAATVLKKFALKFIVWLLAIIAPVVAPLLLIVLVVLLVYTVLFVAPMGIIKDTGRIAIYSADINEGYLGFDRRLYETYTYLGNKWHGDLETTEDLLTRLGPDWGEDMAYIHSQFTQAKPYRLPWSVLAGVDRVAGDEVITRQRFFRPQPEKNFKALKTHLIWKEVAIWKIIEYIEYHSENSYDDEGNITGTTTWETIETREVEASINLLKTANTYEANFEFEYEQIEIERGEQGTGSWRKSRLWVIKTTSHSGPYYGPLINLMDGYGIDDPFDIETVLRLAMAYDEDYSADVNLLGIIDHGFILNLTQSYWQGETGARAAPLPLQYMNNITSPFGMRIHPILRTTRIHTGVDFGAPRGTPIYAFANGLVIYSGSYGSYGRTIIIDHGEFKTLYAHMSGFSVRLGDEVAVGNEIGRVGSTGLSTGPHLHFEIQELNDGKSVQVNPLNYF